MPLRKILHLLFPLSSLACLALGLFPLQQWLFLAGLLMVLLLWLLPLKWPVRWMPYAALVLSAGLGAAGILAGAAPVLMLLGSGLALAAWDLALLQASLAGLPVAPGLSDLSGFARSHYFSLAGAVALGLLAALAGRLVLRLQLPFGILLLLVLLMLIALDRLWHTLGN